MKRILFLFFSVFTSGSLMSQNIIAPTNISISDTWTADTVFLDADVAINNGVVLQVAPGTVVMSRGHYGLYIQGSIRAQGTVQDSIYFIVNDTTGFVDTSVTAGGWKGLYFVNTPSSNDSSLFEYCVMQYGKACGESDIEHKGGVMYVSHFSKIRVSNSNISHNISSVWGGAFYMEYCSATVNNNRFEYNRTYSYGGAIYMGQYSVGQILNNHFYKNTSYKVQQMGSLIGESGAGAAIYVNSNDTENQSPSIIGNYCFNNKAISGIIYESTMSSLIANNVVCNNLGSAIFNGHSIGRAKYINNTIANNNSNNIHNTIIEVHSPYISIKNNIIWNNFSLTATEDTVVIKNDDIRPDSVQYNLLSDTYFQGNGNIHMQDPLFVNPSPGIGLNYNGELYDWSLQDNSPAVNSGKPYTEQIYPIGSIDILGNVRTYGGRIDMGAVENQNVIWTSIDHLNLSAQFAVYPNPGSDFFNLSSSADLSGSVLKVHDLTGREMYGEPLQGQQLRIDAQNWPKGVYIYHIAGKTNQSGKWVKQ